MSEYCHEVTELKEMNLRLLNCGHKRLVPTEWNYSRLCVPYWRWYWNSNPGAQISFDNETLELTPDRIVLVSPYTTCISSNTKTVDHFFFHFQNVPFVSRSLQSMTAIELNDSLAATIKILEQEMRCKESSVWTISRIARAIIELTMANPEVAKLQSPRVDWRVHKALLYIEDHLQPGTHNEELARIAGMSLSAFSRLFRREVGQPIQEYLRIKRVENASLLLQSTTSSLEEIAQQAGFCDQFHFSRVFRRIQGVSPKKYRESMAHRYLK